MKKITVLTGAGVSQESGINTFRDAGGLWEGHDVMEVASPQGFANNPSLVLDFYNQRRKQLDQVLPNKAHQLLAQLEDHFDVTIVTQNVDDLHERAGSSCVIHLHGELLKARSVKNPMRVFDWRQDIALGDLADDGGQLRPHIVWFGEAVPLLEDGALAVQEADIAIIIGTSMQVYPAAGLIGFAQPSIPVFYIDPNPSVNYELERASQLEVLSMKASSGMEMLYAELLKITG